MNPQQQQPNLSTSNSSISSPNLLKFVVPGIALVALLVIIQSAIGSLLPADRKLNLKKVELNPTAASQKKAQVEAPRYGLDDKVVNQEQVAIILRDNGYEDGDYVTLSVNGKVYAPRVYLRNAGGSILVPLNPGANLVQIRGDRDGGGGITLAADVSNQGNMTSSAIPEGGTAMFYILRK